MPMNEERGYHEPAVNREDLARQTAEAERARGSQVNVAVEGADALVEAAEQDLPADATNQQIAEARQGAQEEADRLQAERAGTLDPETGEPRKTQGEEGRDVS